MKKSQIQFRTDERLAAAIAARTGKFASNTNCAARELLERYFHLLQAELSSLDGQFTLAEADAINSWMIEPHTIGLLWAKVDDAIQYEQLDEKWGIDGPALVEKLRGLSYAQTAALLDALERRWIQPEPEASAEGFAKVGIVCRP